MKTLTRIEPFEVPVDNYDLFRRQWHTMAERLSHETGLLSMRLYEVDTDVEAHLQRNPRLQWLQGHKPQFCFYTIAEWASLSHYETALRATLQWKITAFPSYPGYYCLPGSYSRSQELKDKQPFTLIAPFEVPEGQEGSLREQWRNVVEHMAKAGGTNVEGSYGPGLYEMDTQVQKRLHSVSSAPHSRNGIKGRARFHFINVAEWESLSHYEAVLHNPIPVKPIAFPSYPAYYRIIAEYVEQHD